MNRCDGKGNYQLVDDLNRRLPVGAEVARGGEATHFRVWAPLCQEVQVVIEEGSSNPSDSDGNFDLVRRR